MAPMALAYDQPQTTWTQTNSAPGGIYPINAYKSATVGYFGAVWIPGRNVYDPHSAGKFRGFRFLIGKTNQSMYADYYSQISS